GRLGSSVADVVDESEGIVWFKISGKVGWRRMEKVRSRCEQPSFCRPSSPKHPRQASINQIPADGGENLHFSRSCTSYLPTYLHTTSTTGFPPSAPRNLRKLPPRRRSQRHLPVRPFKMAGVARALGFVYRMAVPAT